jgi:hypothetical protein
MNTIGWVLYLAPTALALMLRKTLPDLRLGWLFAANVLFGWTIIGWFGCLGYVLYALMKRSGAIRAGSLAEPLAAAPPFEPTAGPRVCPSCDRGQASCPACGKRQGDWRDSVWVPCSYCLGSGTVQCMTCGGSGELRY